MKLMIASDIHGAAGYCRDLLTAHDRENRPRLLLLGDILLHGHTHVPAWQPFGMDNYYLNPGSVAIPKEGSWHGYMTLENGRFLWKDFDGVIHHELTL